MPSSVITPLASGRRAPRRTAKEAVYPDSDGKPMADNTRQFNYIASIKEGFEALYRDREDIFVAGDLLWYPVLGDPKTRIAPDVLIAFGRPKGYRGSYKQWEEGGHPLDVVFEILSPNNTKREMANKLAMYERFGVQEYYVYDPDRGKLEGYIRTGERLDPVARMGGWVSPLTGVRFELDGMDLHLHAADGQRFLTYLEILERAETAEARLESAEARLESAEARLESAESRLEAEAARARLAEEALEALRARLRALEGNP